MNEKDKINKMSLEDLAEIVTKDKMIYILNT